MELVVTAATMSTFGTFLRSLVEKQTLNYMKQAPEKYHDQLIPKYPLGGKRPLPDHGYIQCTKLPNFSLVQGNGIRGVTEDGKGVIDPAGNVHQIDILVLANGFLSSQLTAPMTIKGDNGIELKDYWKEVNGIRAYQG